MLTLHCTAPCYAVTTTHCVQRCKDGQSTFLYQGGTTQSNCFALCAADQKCNYVTYSTGDRWCFNSQYCNTTNPFAGGSKQSVRTWSKPSSLPGPGLETETEGAGAGAAAANPETTAPLFAGVRELASLSSPWFFQAVPTANASLYAGSWDTAFDPDGLGGPAGLRSAEKRADGYYCGAGCCSWSGPVWYVWHGMTHHYRTTL